MSEPETGRPWLGIYLNDHLAGATTGMELARRAAHGQRSPEQREKLRRLAADITADRASLIELMGTAGVPIRGYKVFAGWLAEKAARLKPNASVLTRSPLSDFIELESLYLGVQGKAAGWRALLAAAANGAPLDQGKLRVLLDRAGNQLDVIDELRIATGVPLFSRGRSGL